MELVKWFLEHGADPNEYTRGGVFGVTNFMRVPLFDHPGSHSSDSVLGGPPDATHYQLFASFNYMMLDQ